MGSELTLVENWRETWVWFLASTPAWTPKLIAAIGVGLAAVALFHIAKGSMGGGGKRAGIGATVLFLIICLAPGPVISLILKLVELLIGVVISFADHLSG
ncbi:hypothetical protein [Pseudactinotalea terrae]|uniref:hypothetical protein n=1 Tax=Pseudactinotalea terrae TaxID=1743262 RepID=UPI001F4FB7B4|nr:hypothetical protein [Pseudactinotalea terrae]